MSNRLHKFALVLVIGLLLAPSLAVAGEAEEIKAAHRATALSYLDSLDPGVMLTGTCLRNESAGTFKAYHFGDEWVVKQQFGGMEWTGYTGPRGSWSGSNYGLPYEVEPEDNPANTVLELITNGSYLDEPYWDDFKYVTEDAGGYIFTFNLAGLPPVDVVLYSDEDMPEYLQIMSVELPMAADDDQCVRYRSFYYFDVDEEGRLLTSRETGRELDANGDSINFVEFTVSERTWITERPAAMDFNFDRQPFSKSAADMAAPVAVEVRLNSGYFLVPVTFSGSEETFWFLLDTGASSSLFSPAAAEAAMLEPALTLPTHGHGSRAEFTLGMCQTASIGEYGNELVPLDGFTATRVPEDNALLEAFAFYGTAGILSVAPLHQYVTTFDEPNSTITFTPPQLFDNAAMLTPDTYVMELDVEDLIYAPAKLLDIAGEVVVDSGLQQDIALLRETVENNDIVLQVVEQRNNTVVGGVTAFDYVIVPRFELVTLPPPDGHRPLVMKGTLASLSEDDHGSLSARKLLGFVGMNMFLGVKVTIDLFAQELYYEVPADMILEGDEDNVPTLFDDDEAELEGAEDEAAGGTTKLPVNIG